MIIGVLGFIGSGKGTIGRTLVERLGFVQDSFAATLKDIVAVIFSWPRELLEGDTDESRTWREQVDPWWAERLNRKDFTPRLALQLVGTNALREHFHPNIWILSLEKRLRDQKDVVIVDSRFANEIAMIKRLGGYTILVQRGEEPEWYSIAKKANFGDGKAKHIMEIKYADIHQSEWAWIGHPVDFTIENDSTIDALMDRTEQLVRGLRNGSLS